MSPLLRAFVNERLTAAVDEIFQVFEGTIAKYEEEASSSKQEIVRLRGLLLELENQRTDVSQSCACKDETTHKHSEQESSVSVHQRELQLPHIKQEDPEVWASDQQEENQTGEETDVSDPPQSSVCEESEQEDTKPLVQPQMQNCELEEEFQEMRVAKTEHFESPPTSTLTASFPSEQMQTEQGQTSLILSREFTDSSHLNHTGADYQCHLCAESFSSSHQLTNHAFRIHSRDVRIVCAVCGKAFESTESLHVHLRSHESSKCCHMCGKHCKSTTTLTEHMASHAGLKLHRCHVCGRECSRKGDLKIHMRIHTGEKPFCCSVCCKSFTHSGHLKKHMRSHTGERPYRCEVCGRGFLQSAHLKYHLGTHKQ